MLDCACYFTAQITFPGPLFQMSNGCLPDLKLKRDCELVYLVQRMTRGGMSSFYASRFDKANNNYRDNFLPSEHPATSSIRTQKFLRESNEILLCQ